LLIPWNASRHSAAFPHTVLDVNGRNTPHGAKVGDADARLGFCFVAACDERRLKARGLALRGEFEDGGQALFLIQPLRLCDLRI
jgi:hypothetical protein